MGDRKSIRKFVVLSILGLLLVNTTVISGLLIAKYGTMTLSPGENYRINIPFIPLQEETGESSIVCGIAEDNDGNPVGNVKVEITLHSDAKILGENITDVNGEYCITLPAMASKSEKYDVSVKYDNDELELGSNDYSLTFEDKRNYQKGFDDYAVLKGYINNEDARIENGRFEINLKYYNDTTDKWIEIFDYQKYHVNIEPGEDYEIPNAELNVSWEIPSDAKIGKYKFYIKTSFNAKERTKNVYFNITV